jgi:hypothetical protein
LEGWARIGVKGLGHEIQLKFFDKNEYFYGLLRMTNGF